MLIIIKAAAIFWVALRGSTKAAVFLVVVGTLIKTSGLKYIEKEFNNLTLFSQFINNDVLEVYKFQENN